MWLGIATEPNPRIVPVPLAKVLWRLLSIVHSYVCSFPWTGCACLELAFFCQLSATCHAHMDASVAGDVLTLPSAPAQISNQLRRVDGVRQGLEDMHKEQDVKATSVVRLASHPLFRM